MCAKCTACPEGLAWAREPSRAFTQVGCARGGALAHRLAFIFLFISRLVCLGGCFSPDTEQEAANQLQEAPHPSRRLCGHTWSSEDPVGGNLTRFEAPIWSVAKCPGLLCWSHEPWTQNWPGHMGQESCPSSCDLPAGLWEPFVCGPLPGQQTTLREGGGTLFVLPQRGPPLRTDMLRKGKILNSQADASRQLMRFPQFPTNFKIHLTPIYT